MIAVDRGLVLRTFALGETSKIVCVLGQEHGKLRLVARGVRATRARSGANLEAGNDLEIVFSQHPARELGVLRESTLCRAWLADRTNLAAMAVGLAALELVDRVVPTGAPEGGLLELSRHLFATVAETPTRRIALGCFYRFELGLLECLGLRPRLEACRVCGNAAQGPSFLEVSTGSWTCGGCTSPDAAPGIRATAAELRLLGELQAAGVQNHESLPLAGYGAAGRLLHRLLGAHVESYRYPRALELLRRAVPGPAALPATLAPIQDRLPGRFDAKP